MALEKERGRTPAKGEQVVVVGAGKSGRAASRLLAEKGVKVRLLDANPNALSEPQKSDLRTRGVEIVLTPHEKKHFADADFIIPSPAMPIASLEKYISGSSPEILSEMELAWRYLDNEPILAVTGTSGKTTTASLAAAMLKAQNYTVFLGGNIGTPLSEYLLAKRRADAIVLEASSFQLQGCSTFCPRVGIILNISPNHLDFHKDMEEYTEAKFRIFRCQDKGDLAILGEDLKEVSEKFPISSRKLFLENRNRFSHMRLLGAHNEINAEAAWQAVRFFGVNFENAERAAAEFNPLPHRLETIRTLDNVLYVNDSKCTTVSSLKVALESFEQPVRLICGGKYKGGDLASLADLIKSRVSEIALFGASREIFEKAFAGLVPVSWQPTLKEAVQKLKNNARPGDVVLLAPATSSFDLYKNYQERGNDFRSIVENL